MSVRLKEIPTTSPCYAREPVEGSTVLREMKPRGKLNIRGEAQNPSFTQGIRSALGMALPLKANTYTEFQSLRLFWLGPDEWLLSCDLEDIGSWQDKLTQSLSGIHHALTEVSDYYTVLRLRGPDSTTLLRRGCPMDLHHEAFPSGNIAQTRFGHASVLLLHYGDGETWDIHVRWSYAEYVWDYLVSAMRALPYSDGTSDTP